jgi:hypothetical protein
MKIQQLGHKLMHPMRFPDVIVPKRRDMNNAFANPSDYRARPHRRQPSETSPTAACGTRVTVRRGILVSDYWIVADEEADPSIGRIAVGSGLARALVGAGVGEAVEYHVGGRTEEIRVLAVRPA